MDGGPEDAAIRLEGGCTGTLQLAGAYPGTDLPCLTCIAVEWHELLTDCDCILTFWSSLLSAAMIVPQQFNPLSIQSAHSRLL